MVGTSSKWGCPSNPTWGAVETHRDLAREGVLPSPPSPIHLTFHPSIRPPPTHSPLTEFTLHSRLLAKRREGNNGTESFQTQAPPRSDLLCPIWELGPTTDWAPAGKLSPFTRNLARPPPGPTQLPLSLSVHLTFLPPNSHWWFTRPSFSTTASQPGQGQPGLGKSWLPVLIPRQPGARVRVKTGLFQRLPLPPPWLYDFGRLLHL